MTGVRVVIYASCINSPLCTSAFQTVPTTLCAISDAVVLLCFNGTNDSSLQFVPGVSVVPAVALVSHRVGYY